MPRWGVMESCHCHPVHHVRGAPGCTALKTVAYATVTVGPLDGYAGLMTLDYAINTLAALTNLTEDDIRDAMMMSPADLQAYLQINKDSMAVTERSAFDTFRADLHIASGIASELSPIAGLVAAIALL